MINWYVVQTKLGQENVAEENLAKQGFNTFIPLMRVYKLRGRRRQLVTEPLFPGYLFIELDIDHQNIAPVRSLAE